MKFPVYLLALLFWLSACSNQGSQAQHTYTNDLVHESSPYLLQHAHNPVEWKAWNEQTLKKAKAENKMILVSIGYAACHWCHVMEEESFQDTAVANLMNRHFINIKVDREERPDVDDVYMTACQLVSEGGCGWPLNAMALPNGKPVWAGTYFPKKQWVDILKYFIEEYKTPERLQQYAEQLTAGVQLTDSISISIDNTDFSPTALDNFTTAFFDKVDFKKGGLDGQLKFPMPGSFDYLLQYHHARKSDQALKAVEITLDKMAQGGIFDQLAGGFARYSTDPNWKVPHFEKMLYDNGQLIGLYANTYKVTGNRTYKKTIEEITSFLNQTLQSPEGAYYASMNADSEGEEGKYYVWTEAEISDLFQDEITRSIVLEYFNIKPKGNWEEQKNVLHNTQDISKIAKKLKLEENIIAMTMKAAKKHLSAARQKRIAPTIDDKILTSWNALLLSGFVTAYEALQDPTYLEYAQNIATFIEEKMIKEDGRLDRNFKSGKSSINAFLDDYAYTIAAYVDLYEITFEEKYLNTAEQLTEYAIAHFSRPESPFLFYTSDIDPPLVARKTPISDNVIPAANAIMAHNLFNMGQLLYQETYLERSASMLNQVKNELANSDAPAYYYSWAALSLKFERPPYEIVIMGKEAIEKRKQLAKYYTPNAIFLGSQEESKLALTQNKFVAGKTLIYVCQNKTCKLPVEKVEQALTLLE